MSYTGVISLMTGKMAPVLHLGKATESRKDKDIFYNFLKFVDTSILPCKKSHDNFTAIRKFC
jgi:hypothetical protein